MRLFDEAAWSLPRTLRTFYLFLCGGLLLTYATLAVMDLTSMGPRLAVSFEWLSADMSSLPQEVIFQRGATTSLGHHMPRLGSIIDRHGPNYLSRADRDFLGKAIITASLSGGVDPLLTAAVIKQESGFRRTAISSKGARGLMQIIPSTGQFVATQRNFEWRGSHALFDPTYNVRLGVAYLRDLQQQFNGNWFLALSAYNWGPGNVERALKAGRRVPREVAIYASSILFNYSKWRTQRPSFWAP